MLIVKYLRLLSPWDQPPAPQPSQFADHVAALSEYRALSLLPLALQPMFRPHCSCVFFADVLLEEFRGHQEGADPTPRLVNNVGSIVFRIRNFIAFMVAGHTDLSSLGFFNQTARMRSWHNSLNHAKIVEPTVHMYLKNMAQFLAYVTETPPPTCWLSCSVMVGLNREIKAMIRSVRWRVVMHEVAVKQAEEGHLIPKATLRQCVASAKTVIPEVLGKFLPPLTSQTSAFHTPPNASPFFLTPRLKVTGDRKDQWSFYGHLTACPACICGHRGGLFQT